MSRLMYVKDTDKKSSLHLFWNIPLARNHNEQIANQWQQQVMFLQLDWKFLIDFIYLWNIRWANLIYLRRAGCYQHLACSKNYGWEFLIALTNSIIFSVVVFVFANSPGEGSCKQLSQGFTEVVFYPTVFKLKTQVCHQRGFPNFNVIYTSWHVYMLSFLGRTVKLSAAPWWYVALQ